MTLVPGERYSTTHLNAVADVLLRQDARRELCRTCGEDGTMTGKVESRPQHIYDDEGNQLIVDFPEIACRNEHAWFKGEGKERGIGGDNPILLEEHLHSRKRREIYCQNGIPDPEIVQGSYNKSHPSGRAVNTPEARAAGAAYYK